MTAQNRRPSFVMAEAEEQEVCKDVATDENNNAQPEKAAAPRKEVSAQAAHEEMPSNDFTPTAMAEAEEVSLATDRRQMSVEESKARAQNGGAYTSEPKAAFATDLPQNAHVLAGSAEAEEMAYAFDRQVSAGGEEEVVRRPSAVYSGKAVEIETPKAALERRCSHDLAGAAEAEEMAYAFDRQVSADLQVSAGGPAQGA